MEVTAYGKKFDFEPLMRDLADVFKTYQVPIITLLAVQEDNPFKVLISTMLSARTKDETTAVASERLYAVAPTAQKLAALDLEQVEKLIYPVGFWKTKAPRIKAAAQKILDDFAGKVPETIEELISFEGVGRKTANLVLGEAFKTPAICVDVHVHRISNRIGLIETKTPYETEQMLEIILPREHWIRYNTYIVAHGQHTCKPISPICSKCAIAAYCKRIGVDKSR